VASAPSSRCSRGCAAGGRAERHDLLEPLELGAYDRLLRWAHPADEANPRVVLPEPMTKGATALRILENPLIRPWTAAMKATSRFSVWPS
jgi:hypothetical protein